MREHVNAGCIGNEVGRRGRLGSRRSNLRGGRWRSAAVTFGGFPAGRCRAGRESLKACAGEGAHHDAANRELGRALKTEFVLQYMSEPQLRAKVRRGLLKVEQLHALARAVYYGQRGRISAREVYDQMNASAPARSTTR